jgi:hypothetical protein
MTPIVGTNWLAVAINQLKFQHAVAIATVVDCSMLLSKPFLAGRLNSVGRRGVH